MDKFIIKGLCKKCGELVGNLKPTSVIPLSMFTSMHTSYPEHDPVLYHVSSIFTKARIKCPIQ